jgi:outer membrane lipoprotein-sorting protein
MEKLRIIIMMLLVSVVAQGQTAKQVLDKTAAVVSDKNGVQANFSIKGAQMQTSGTFAVKGRKFHATTPQATMWFDGKTMWTYMKKNDEVNVSNPTESQLAAINPYNFINLYKKGFRYSMTKNDKIFTVHLTSNDSKQKIKEMFISIEKKGYTPTEVKILQNGRWTIFTISDFKRESLSDGLFKFNSKDFPSAEVIDLR